MANLPSYIDMNIDSNFIKRRSTSLSKTNSREALVLLNASFTPYYERMKINNNLLDGDIWDLINSSQISYDNNVEIGNSVRKMTDNYISRDLQHIWNKALALKNILKSQDEGVFNTNMYPSQDTINIQLPYNVNQIMELNSWNGNFYSISLHSSLEHLPSDSKNIKESLHWITKYIKNKKIENNKANEVLDLKDIGKAI